MDPTLRFLLYIIFSALSLAGGYLCRKRQLLNPAVSKPLHYHTVVWVWSAASLFSVWKIPLSRDHLWLGLFQTLIVALLAFTALGIARGFKFSRDQSAIVAVAASIHNIGFTLGAYICYTLITPADSALALGIYYVSIMQVVAVIVIYPLARRYGHEHDPSVPLSRLMIKNFLDLRAMPLYAAVAGTLLATYNVPYPQFVRDFAVLDILFYLGAFGAYFGIGLHLELTFRKPDLKVHALAAALKFLLIPALTLLMIWLLALAGQSLSRPAYEVALVQSAMPTALWTPMLANLFGLNHRLAVSVWFYNHVLFALLILPIILFLYR